MKKFIFIIAVLLLTVSSGVNAADLIGGEFKLENTYYESMKEKHPELMSVFNLELDQQTWNGGFHIDLKFSDDLNKNQLEIALNEAYINYYGDDYDLHFGKQLISWGTAAEFNPTDNINPMNPEDIFGDKQVLTMLKGNYYLNNNYELSGVIIPFHRPVKDSFNFMGNEFKVEAVEDDLANTEYAIKLSGKGIEGFDYSLSYYHGFEDIPTAVIKMTPGGPVPDKIYFREYSIYGVDFATSHKGVGYWLEAAYTVPEQGDEYYSSVIGADYKFENGFYLEGQLIYQKDKFLNENVIIQQGLEKEFARIHNFKLGSLYNLDTEGYMIKPQFEFSLDDNLILNLSYTESEGDLMGNEIFNLESGLNMDLTYSF